jgi:PAS domain S-box-containing protein
MNYKLLLEKSPICFAQVDIDKGILYANPALSVFTGYTCEELKTKKFSDITHPDDLEKDITEFHKMLRREIDEYRLQRRYIQKSGKIVWGDLFVSLIPDELRDTHFSILASIVDITEVKHKEAALKKEKSNFKALFMNNPQAMLIYSIETLDVLEINEAVSRMYGYSRDEFLKLKISDFLYNEEMDLLNQYLAEDPLKTLESKQWTIRTKSGKRLIVEGTSHQINYKGINARHALIIDITARKENEIALLENREFNRFAQRIAKMGSWEYDLLTQKSKFSTNLYRMLQYNPEEITPSFELLRNRVHQDDLEMLDSDYNRIFIEQTAKDLELRLLLPDGQIIWIQSTIEPVFEQDRLVKLRGICLDITERKTNEIALLRNRDSIRQAQVIAKMGSWEYDPIHDKGFWSKNLYHLLKVDPAHSDLSFDFFKSLVHPDDLHYFDECMYKVIQPGENKVLEIRLLLPDQEYIWVECHVDLDFENDQIVNIRGVIIDITEKKKKEIELLKLSKAIEQSPVSIIITDTKGNIEYVNPKFTESTGYAWHEVIEKNPRILKSHQIDDLIYADLWTTISSGKVWKGELINKTKTGDCYWERESISPLFDEKGEIINYVSVGEDITLQKKNETELIEAKEKAEEGSRLKSSFLAIISHELRTPLNPIIGFSSILMENSSDEMVIEFAGMIHKSGNDMLYLLEDLFDLSFSKGQHVQCNNKPVLYIDLYSIAFASLEELIINSGKSDQIEIVTTDYAQCLNYELEIDQAKVLHVLSILFKNAVKFIKNGEIEFGTEINKDIKTIKLFVRDTGIGIEEEKIKIIFNRFRQANDSTTRTYGGLGIGLTIARQLVNIMGGTIDVQSQVGIGSEFSFTIPVNINLKEDIENSNNLIHEDDLSVLNGKTILIVDDNLFVHEIIKIQLRKFDIKLLPAANGLEAIWIVKNQVPDFILMDLVMPVMDGFEAIAYIRALHPKLPISALTAHSLPKDRQRALEVGCDEIITKPVHRDILLHILKKHLKHNIYSN